MRKLSLIALLLQTCLLAAAQSVPITGRITSAADGEPLTGVTVTVSGTTTGALSAPDGTFSIPAEKGQTLVFSIMGYGEKRITVEERRSIDVELDYDSTQLDELIVIGYGTMRKSDLTGAVASVKGETLQKVPVATVNEALQGRVAGVTVTSDTGQPGSGATIRIRGIGSVNAGASPLYVVDGMIVNDINFLSPNDIASSEILKDASSAAIYGSRAANGVILITTKSGTRSDRANISFDAYFGVQSRWNKLDLLGRDEFIDTFLKLNAGNTEKGVYADQGLNGWLNAYRIGTANSFIPRAGDGTGGTFNFAAQDTDWQDEVFKRNAVIQNYHLSVDGGTDRLNYAMSANYFSQDGTIMGSNYERINLRLNTSYKVRDWLRIGEILNFSTSKSRWAMNNNSSPGASVLSGALAMAPWDPTHYPEGTLNYRGDDLGGRIAAASNFKNVTNPFSMEKHSHNRDVDHRWLGSLYLDITPLEGLTLHSDMGFDLNYNRDRGFADAYEYSSYDKRTNNSVGQGAYYGQNIIFNNYATYARTIGKHDFSAMIGHIAEISKNEGVSAGGANIKNSGERFWSVAYATSEFSQGGHYRGPFRRMSAIGRLHYAYDNRYLVTFSWRSDANRAFQENLWGHYPSVAAAWRLSEESWLRDARDISQLKLRLGWGRLGNDDVDSNLSTMEMFTSNHMFVGYPLGPGTGDVQNIVTGAAVIAQKNAAVRWERTEHWNAGLDFGFWRNRLSGSVDLFIRDTKDMLLYVQWPHYAGVLYSAPDNIGTMRNKGIEFTLEHQNSIRTARGPLFYSFGGNMSFIKNTMTNMNGGDRVWGNYTVTDEGFAVNSFWGYNYTGIYRSQEEIDAHLWGYAPKGLTHNYRVGDAIYADLNGDGMLDDQQDMTVIGNPFPKFAYGFNISAAWMNIDVQMFFQGVYGNTIYNALRLRTENKGTESQLSTAMRDVWTADNPGGSIPNPLNSINFFQSDRFLESGSYLRLKNLQLGYTLPVDVTRRMQIRKLRVYLAANNLFTITNYTGYDPEVGGGVDYGNYPQSRTFMLGVNVNF